MTQAFMDTDGKPRTVSPTSPLPVVAGGSGATAQQVQGNVAAGTADAGNPVKVGGRYNTTSPTLTNGQRGDLQLDTNGNLEVTLFNSGNIPNLAGATNADGVAVATTASRLGTVSFGYVYNGSTWDRQRGNAAGTFVERTQIFSETATVLAASATLTGVTRDTAAVPGGVGTRFKNFVAEVFTDQAGTLYIDKSTDGTNWRQAATLAVSAGVNATLEAKITCRYYRMRYVNGATVQTVFLPTDAFTV